MPRLDGYDALRLIQADSRLDKLLVCMVTGIYLPLSHPLLKVLGAKCVMLKPKSFDELLAFREQVRRALDGAVKPAAVLLASANG